MTQLWKSILNIQEISKGDIIKSIIIKNKQQWSHNSQELRKIGIVISENHKNIYDIFMIDLNTNLICNAVSNPGESGRAYIDKFSYDFTNPRKKRKILNNPNYLIY